MPSKRFPLLTKAYLKSCTMFSFCFAIAILAIVIFPVVRSATTADSLTVRLTSGTFRGLPINNGTERWLGIPFAQPPIGSLRFRAPVAITRPSTSVKTASDFGGVCPQVPSSSLGAQISEDCLFLNVRLLNLKILPLLINLFRSGDPRARVARRNFRSSYGST